MFKYFQSMKKDVMDGKYEASETEMIVLEKYLGNYIEIKLSVSFILDVCRPVMDLISFFESEKVRIQDRHAKLVLLFHDYLGKFMHNAGLEDNNNIHGEDLLKVKYTDKEKQLGDDDVYLGPKVESLLKGLGLTRKSKEIKPWLSHVRSYYEEALFKMKKYFSASIKSKTLRALSVLSPKSWTNQSLDFLKRQWRLLGEKFHNVLKVEELPSLLTEVTLLKAERGLDGGEGMTVDTFFSTLNRKVDDDGIQCYPLLTKLGSSLSTIYNSSSPAERDFLLMNLIVGDPKKNRTSQLLLLAKMFITAEIRSLAKDCQKCLTLLQVGEQSSHCHCHLWHPPEDLLVTMRDGKPSQRYKQDMEKKKKEEETVAVLKEMEQAEDMIDAAKDMKEEVIKLKKRARDHEANKKAAAAAVPVVKKRKKGDKSASAKIREEKRRRLGAV